MKISLHLVGHYSTSGPTCIIDINKNIFWKGTLAEGHNIIEFDFEPLEKNTLSIHHLGKTNEDTIVDEHGTITADKAIELKSVEIEDIAILQNILFNSPYYVIWPDNLVEDFKNKGEEAPEYLKNNLYFGFNGHYSFEFLGDFVKQYYKQFWDDESQAHTNLTNRIQVNGRQIETFERFGDQTAIDQEFDLTIHDLSDMINNDKEF